MKNIPIKQAVNNFKMFHWFNPDKKSVIINIPSVNDKRFKYLGLMTELIYISNKFDKIKRIHKHIFKYPVLTLIKLSGKKSAILLRNVKVNYRGLID